MAEALSVAVDLLRPNPWNSNAVSPENEAKLDRAVKRFGLFKPIVVRVCPSEPSAFEILGGEHRWGSARRVGLKEVPIFNLGEIDDERAKEISLADNARYGVDDAFALAEMLKELSNADQLAEFLPYTETDLSAIFDSTIALDELDLAEDDDIPDEKSDEPAAPKPARTHAVMKFKVTNADAERITKVIAEVQRDLGLTGDEMSNAGDALAHILLNKPASEPA